MAAGQPDKAMLAQRIQGFGNVNPPPLEEETGATVAKKALGRLGDMVGEEVMLTVEDFKEKGAVGAVKDAVADAGDILIDGVSGIIGWIRGEPPAEEESEKAEDATKALAYGPNGAAYGISQASPTGGINAVWVMPEEADPQAMAQLAAQQGGRAVNDPRVPKNIQPYQPPAGSRAAPPPTSFNQPMQVPGGPVIAPYTPAPAGPSHRPPFVPGAGPGFPAAGFQQGAAAAGASGRWGPGGYSGPAPGAGAGSGASSSASGAKGFVERIAKGDVLVGADAAKRLVSQCSHAKTTAKQLAEMVCERSRRLYLGLDGGDPAEADAALARLLALTDAIYSSDTSDFAKTAVEEIKKGVSEEFMSLRSSAKHKDGALPALQRLGFLGAKAAQEADLLGGEAEVDLLGGGGAVQAAAPSADLLGGEQSSSAPSQPASAGLVDTLDPLLSAPSAPSGGLLAGLALDAPAPASAPAAPAAPAAPGAKAGTLGAGATLPKDSAKEDIFGFVGAEMSKANK